MPKLRRSGSVIAAAPIATVQLVSANGSSQGRAKGSGGSRCGAAVAAFDRSSPTETSLAARSTLARAPGHRGRESSGYGRTGYGIGMPPEPAGGGALGILSPSPPPPPPPP